MKTPFFILIALSFLAQASSFAADTNTIQPAVDSSKPVDATKGAADMPADKMAANKAASKKKHMKKNWKHQMNQDPTHKTQE